MSDFTADTGHIASVIYTTYILFSEISIHVTLLNILNLLSSLSKWVRQISKTDLPHSLICGPKVPQFAQSPENRVLLNPKLLTWAFLGKQDFCKISLERLPPRYYQSENTNIYAFLCLGE